MARMDVPSEEQMTPEQKEVRDEAVAGIRGRMPTPMIPWLRNPELARRAQKLGELLRYQTTLGQQCSELAILVCGRHWTAHMEWVAHKREGLKAGLDAQVIADIAARRTPKFTDKRQQVVYELAKEIMATGRLSKASYQLGLDTLTERGLVELVAILGYYTLAGFTLNVFEMGLPDNVAPELEDPEYPAKA